MHGFDYGWARSSRGGFEREGSSLLEIEGERWREKKNDSFYMVTVIMDIYIVL